MRCLGAGSAGAAPSAPRAGGAAGGGRCHWPRARKGRCERGGAARGLAGARSGRRRLARGAVGGRARGGGPRCGGRRWRRAGGGRGMEALPGELGPGRARPRGRSRPPTPRGGRAFAGPRLPLCGRRCREVSRGGPCGTRRGRCLLSPRPGRTPACGERGAFWSRPAAPSGGRHCRSAATRAARGLPAGLRSPGAGGPWERRRGARQWGPARAAPRPRCPAPDPAGPPLAGHPRHVPPVPGNPTDLLHGLCPFAFPPHCFLLCFVHFRRFSCILEQFVLD